MRIDDPSSQATWPASSASTGTRDSADGTAFSWALVQAKATQDTPAPGTSRPWRTLKPNDTLTQIVRQEAAQRGVSLTAQQEYQAVLSLAKDNQLSNPDRIWAGQTLNVGPLRVQLGQLQQAPTAAVAPELTPPTTLSASAPADRNYSPQMSSTQEVLRVVKSRDTLSQIVRQEASSRGIELNQAQIYKEVLALAKDNDLSNPNQIRVGQTLKIQQLQAHLSSTAAATSSNASAPKAQSSAAVAVTEPAAKVTPANTTAHSVLQQTLDRAVARGFIPANEKQDVYNKILQVANKHRFSPDDFARLTLMESDGMNPQATNQRCHGIIQFCEGPAQGAAGVGYGQAPKAILNLSVYQQLHLVDTYFDKVGLKKQGQVQLDELYLAVLQPAARAETRPEVPLEIPGNQAHALYEGRNPQAPITRNSIIQGLLKNTIDRLSMSIKSPAAKVSSSQSRTGSSPPERPTPTAPESL